MKKANGLPLSLCLRHTHTHIHKYRDKSDLKSANKLHLNSPTNPTEDARKKYNKAVMIVATSDKSL